ncbi:c-type cytochrome [Lutimaribacter marinistellae]|uniref:C-type cytochrome n=1 Tax=Lutimaribacter marinistellae TaxID=1820329 RepID=A0ABV7TJ19_9RHOB
MKYVIAGALSLLGLAGCMGDAPPSGAALYKAHCVSCHGPTGAGDGPDAAKLRYPPANLRGMAAANGGVFPADAVMAKIHGHGGQAFASAMPEFGPLMDGPTVPWTTADGQVIATPEALVALTRYVEGLQDV